MAQNTLQAGVERITQGINDFVKTYIKEIDSNIPFSGVSSPSASNGTEKAAVGVGFAAGFVVPEGEGAKGPSPSTQSEKTPTWESQTTLNDELESTVWKNLRRWWEA